MNTIIYERNFTGFAGFENPFANWTSPTNSFAGASQETLRSRIQEFRIVCVERRNRAKAWLQNLSAPSCRKPAVAELSRDEVVMNIRKRTGIKLR